ncbi:hypothetical protein O3Q51_17445 [Cryomorphaceae bacterium 1068]|nr:hypothetical protein [Cryomorphaceae bacterium 1068]
MPEKLKILMCFLILTTSIKCQESIDEQLINSIVQTELQFHKDQQIRITSSVDSSRLNHHLRIIDSLKESSLLSRNREDTLVLNPQEIQMIEDFFKDMTNLSIPNIKDLEHIPGDEYVKYLMNRDIDYVVISVSRPLFIRNNEFGICYFSSLSGKGNITGPTSISVYKQKDGIWTRTYDLSSGIF